MPPGGATPHPATLVAGETTLQQGQVARIRATVAGVTGQRAHIRPTQGAAVQCQNEEWPGSEGLLLVKGRASGSVELRQGDVVGVAWLVVPETLLSLPDEDCTWGSQRDSVDDPLSSQLTQKEGIRPAGMGCPATFPVVMTIFEGDVARKSGDEVMIPFAAGDADSSYPLSRPRQGTDPVGEECGSNLSLRPFGHLNVGPHASAQLAPRIMSGCDPSATPVGASVVDLLADHLSVECLDPAQASLSVLPWCALDSHHPGLARQRSELLGDRSCCDDRTCAV